MEIATMTKTKTLSQSPANRLLVSAGLVFLLLATSIPALGAEQEPETNRQRELIHLLVQDCGSCHGLTLKGGLGPALLPKDLEGKDSEYLSEIILYGVPGTPMPPWDVEISKNEVRWLVRRMREGEINDR